MTESPAYPPAPFATLYPHLVAGIVFLLLAGLLAGCATSTPGAGDHVYEYRQYDRFVRLQPSEPGSPANDHPYPIDAQTLQTRLADLKASGNITLAGNIEAFTDDELSEMAGPVATALSTANPNQDVTFQSRGYRGTFGRYSPPSFSSGRVFVRNGQLNLIFGTLHSRIDPDSEAYTSSFFPLGSRAGRSESGWELVGDGELVEGRGDWIRLTLSRPGGAAPPAARSDTKSAVPDQPESHTSSREATDSGIEQRTQEIESRLRVLEDLKNRNLISEEEYRKQRSTILQGI